MWGTEIRAAGHESFLAGDIDIQSLRRRREEPMGNLPAIVRMRLYARGYAEEGSNAPPSPSTREEWISAGHEKVAASVR